jgi:hypothetical protein
VCAVVLHLITGESLVWDEGVVPLFVEHFVHCLVEHIDPKFSPCDWSNVGALLDALCSPSCTATMDGQSGVVLYLRPPMINCF